MVELDEEVEVEPARESSTERDRLRALNIARITEPGFHHDGGGLYLQVSPKGTKSWVFRYRLNGRTRDMGLGSVLDFTLAEARDRARKHRQLVADKIDPIDYRDERSKAAKALNALEKTFEECAHEVHRQESKNWKNKKHSAQWINTLRDYAFEKIGRRKMHTVGKDEILAVLTPIWTSNVVAALNLTRWGCGQNSIGANP